MDLIVNGTALRSSLGVRRLHANIMRHLHWPGAVEITGASGPGAVARLRELTQRGRRGAIFWSPTHRGPLYAHHHVVSVHDCINVEFVYRHDWRLPVFRRLFNAVLARAEVVVALSRATRGAILRNYSVDPAKITVIPAGFDTPGNEDQDAPLPGAAAAPGEKPPEPRPFVLLVTNCLPHKNTLQGCVAFMHSKAAASGLKLRVVGATDDARLRETVRGSGAIEFCDRVADDVLARWYRDCAFLFSPTLAEGYNLPISEAIAAGANVLCSDIEVHREFFDGQATFFDPNSEDAMVEALNAAVDCAGRWHPLMGGKRRGFKEVAADYRRVFERIAASS